MAEKPILFNTEMVRAILAGQKIVTRRLVKPRCPGGKILDERPPYQAGDILYVRETWARLVKAKDGEMQAGRYVYKATDEYPFGESGYIVKFRWRPSIHMPKIAARIFLKVTDVRVEQLQDGFKEQSELLKEGMSNGEPWEALAQFIQTWNSTIKKQDLDRYGWDANPWVWVIEFERIEKEKENGNR